MKHLLMLSILPWLVVLAMACEEAVTPPKGNDLGWRIVQSPVTHLCYEVMAWDVGVGSSIRGYAAGGTVSCEYLGR